MRIDVSKLNSDAIDYIKRFVLGMIGDDWLADISSGPSGRQNHYGITGSANIVLGLTVKEAYEGLVFEDIAYYVKSPDFDLQYNVAFAFAYDHSSIHCSDDDTLKLSGDFVSICRFINLDPGIYKKLVDKAHESRDLFDDEDRLEAILRY